MAKISRESVKCSIHSKIGGSIIPLEKRNKNSQRPAAGLAVLHQRQAALLGHDVARVPHLDALCAPEFNQLWPYFGGNERRAVYLPQRVQARDELEVTNVV